MARKYKLQKVYFDMLIHYGMVVPRNSKGETNMYRAGVGSRRVFINGEREVVAVCSQNCPENFILITT